MNLDNPVIFGIIEDKSGNIWFGDKRCVSLLRKSVQLFY
ncbi:MAG: hypothetical protein IPP25_14990 [Saprospiraceae bacterium]|nr:hypothetical protein [Candidatus Opimibacter skivensis]